MYIVISRSGSMASSVSSWAITSLAEASSIWTPRKMIRSSKSLLYGFISLIPYEVRSTKDGSTYLDCGCITFGSWLVGWLAWRWRGAGWLLSACWASRAHAHGGFGGAADHVVDEAVLLGLRGRVPAVPVSVPFDLLDGLPGVEGGPLEQGLLHVEHLLGLDADVRGRAADAPGGLVHQDGRMGQRVALAGRAGGEQELPHRRGHAHREGGDSVGHELHHVVDREAGVHRAARGVDVQVDVAVGVLGGQQQDLGADPVGDFVIHLLSQEDDAVPQQPLEQLVPGNHGGVRARCPGNWQRLCHVVTCSGHFGCR